MSSTVETKTIKTTKAKAIGRRQGIALFAIVFGGLLAAIAAKQFDWVPSSTTNNGTILTPPKLISELKLVDDQGADLLATGGKWRLLIPYSKDCGESCKNNLYISRQVHIRLADKASRVERTLLAFDDIQDQREQLSKEHPRMRFAQIDKKALQQWLADTNAPADSIAAGSYFLVDQRGYMMMFYSHQHSGNELLKDLKYLLRISYEGKQ